jgi:hypothetical protein
VENSARRFWLGVQWHPEYLPQQESHQKIFAALAEAAREVCAITPTVEQHAGAARGGEQTGSAVRSEPS